MPIRVDSLGIARDADAEKLRFDRLNNPELVAQSRNATVGGVLKNRQDQVDLQYSLDTAVSKTDAGVAAFGASKAEDNVAQIVAENPYALFAKMSANKVEAKRNGTELKLEPLRYIEQSKELKKLAQQHQTETSAARRDEMKLSAMYQYQKGIQSGKYGTGENFNNEQATNDFLQLTAAFEGQPAAAALYNKYVKDGNETELAKVVQTGMVFGAKVKSALQKPDGVFKVVELFDVENGGAFGMRLDTQHPKGPRIVETNEDGSDFRVVAQGADMTALGANLQALTGPSAMIGLADQMALRKKEGLDNQTAEQSIKTSAAAVDLSEANIKRINQEILSASGERKLNQAQTKLLTQKAQQIVSELQQEDTGLSFGAKQKEYYKATAKFLTTYLVNNPSGDGLDAATANFKAQLMGGDFAGYEIVE